MSVIYRPDLLYRDGAFHRNEGLRVDDAGRIEGIATEVNAADTIIDLRGKALLPGFVNAHSHAFQRLIRGKAESRVTSGKDFWSWRGTMYHAAGALGPKQMYDVARMVFLEMATAGITTVGEFHYVHNQPGGAAYDDPNLLARQVIAAARSVGIRIVLLRSAYLRSGFELPPDPGQARFYETADAFLKNAEALRTEAAETVHVGIAPHSIRAVPLRELREITAWGRAQKMPIHMHIAEQVAENEACVREYGAPPVTLLGREGLLGEDWTAIHAIHITPEEMAMLRDTGATICSCPTTERNLGDGILAADAVMREKIPIALGSDSQAQIDPLEDARELDYHLRLAQQQRVILDQIDSQSIAKRLFDCATSNGARALHVPAGGWTAGSMADFFTVDLHDISIAGHSADDLLSLLVFGMNRSAIRDVVVQGRFVMWDRMHPLAQEIVAQYEELHRNVWEQQR